jgi:hypothetical protein
MHAVVAMQRVFEHLAQGRVDFVGKGIGFEAYKDLVGFQHWSKIETKFAPPSVAT